jgi:hypothetical protein
MTAIFGCWRISENLLRTGKQIDHLTAEQITVVGLEPERVDIGAGLSPGVSRSISTGADKTPKIIRAQLG